MYEIRLIVSDSGLRRLRSVLTLAAIGGGNPPTAAPLGRIVAALGRGDDQVTIQTEEDK